jgi:hypothetical protein
MSALAAARERRSKSGGVATAPPEGPWGRSGCGLLCRCQPHSLVLLTADLRLVVLSTLDLGNQRTADVVLYIVRHVVGVPATRDTQSLVLFSPHA